MSIRFHIVMNKEFVQDHYCTRWYHNNVVTSVHRKKVFDILEADQKSIPTFSSRNLSDIIVPSELHPLFPIFKNLRSRKCAQDLLSFLKAFYLTEDAFKLIACNYLSPGRFKNHFEAHYVS